MNSALHAAFAFTKTDQSFLRCNDIGTSLMECSWRKHKADSASVMQVCAGQAHAAARRAADGVNVRVAGADHSDGSHQLGGEPHGEPPP